MFFSGISLNFSEFIVLGICIAALTWQVSVSYLCTYLIGI